MVDVLGIEYLYSLIARSTTAYLEFIIYYFVLIFVTIGEQGI